MCCKELNTKSTNMILRRRALLTSVGQVFDLLFGYFGGHFSVNRIDSLGTQFNKNVSLVFPTIQRQVFHKVFHRP